MKYTEYNEDAGRNEFGAHLRVKAESIQPFNPCWLVSCWKRMR